MLLRQKKIDFYAVALAESERFVGVNARAHQVFRDCVAGFVSAVQPKAEIRRKAFQRFRKPVRLRENEFSSVFQRFGF